MHFDPMILVHLLGVLNSIELSDEQLAHYDALADHIRTHGGSLKDASRATGLPITYQALTIVLFSCLYKWFDKGLDSALALPEPETFDLDIAKADAADREIVKCVARATRCLAWADIGDDEDLHQAGTALFTLAQSLLQAPKDRMELAISLSLASREILDKFSDPDAKIAQLYAYRMLVHPKRLPFLPDLPPMKFPPPLPSDLDENLSLNLCLEFIRQGVLDQDLDLGVIARDMREDPESVINNKVEVEIDGDRRSFSIEIAFGRGLIDWAFNQDKWSEELGVNWKIRGLLEVLCKNEDSLEMFRDDDYGHVYQTIYFGFDDDPGRLKIALKIEALGGQIRGLIGLSVADVRVNNARDHLLARHRAELLERIKSAVAAEA